ncbi:sterol desaturase family protein [Erythrobacter sp. SDW2]|uniref:sterol desaturase family protein n=1 Tax=Erythrobacter sp. SDW2 TaxID=2907154 RepID=UPI001F2E2A0D|nr:sterol desaturase family protein [Erythrobacter sp. SDW2]UIP06852.1 sterol desaturase family protein [Erythrobacter sp. SDW2]
MELFGLDAPLVSFAIIAAVFLLFAGIELAVPFRQLSQPKPQRWVTNLVLFAIDTLAVRLLVPGAMLGAAVLAAERGWGLFHAMSVPPWLAVALTVLALDLALWVQHWATHRVPLLWRMHRVHHADRDFDVTTAARFHPFEIVLSMLYKMAVVIALGAPVLAVFLFEVLFTAATLFNHSNTRLPPAVERPVRLLLVTPDMHRIHHSARVPETNSNYGTLLPWWDRLLGTYVSEPQAGQEGLTIGLDRWQDDQPRRLGFSLRMPFLPGAQD